MTLTGFIEVLKAFFKFPEAVVALVKILSKTPEQKHDDMIKRVNNAFDEQANGGRPGEI